MNNLDLFAEPEPGVPPMVRTPDTETAHIAKEKVEWGSKSMREQIYKHIKWMQPITALEIEELPMFEALAPSTVRKRVSELKATGRIIVVGKQQFKTRSGRVATADAYRIATEGSRDD